MNETIILGIVPQGTEWLLILLVIVILFGASKLPQLAKALGQSKRAFKEGQEEADEEARIEASKRREHLRAREADRLDEEKLASDKYTASK